MEIKISICFAGYIAMRFQYEHCYFLFLEKKKGKRNGSLRTKNPDSYRDQGKPDGSARFAKPAPPSVFIFP